MKKVNWKNYNLSKLCLGTVQFGLDYGIANSSGKVNFNEAKKILDFLISKDINCFDTAQAYGNSELVLGKYFYNNSQNINFISKIGSEKFNDSYLQLKKQVEISLNNLSSDKLFGLLLHDSKIISNWSSLISSNIQRLKKDNLIENFGISIYNDEEFNFAINNDDIDIIQIPFNLFDQRAIKLSWLELANKNNKLIFIRSIYLQGLLLMNIENIPIHLKEVIPFIRELDLLCKKYNMTRNELSLSFVNQIVNEGILLFGCDNLSQAKNNIEIFEKEISLDLDILHEIELKFSEIDEKIYNPNKWNKK